MSYTFEVEQTSVGFMETFLEHGLDPDTEYEKLGLLERWAAILRKHGVPPKTWEAFADKGIYVCSNLESSLFICGVEETLYRFNSIGGHDAKPKPPLPDIKAPSTVRDYTRHRHIYDRNTLETVKDAAKRYQRCKVQTDRHFAERSLAETRTQLMTSNTFTPLQVALGYLKMRLNERFMILRARTDCESLLKAQTAILNVEQYVGASAQYTMDASITMLRQELHDSFILCSTRNRTVSKHEASRREQHIMKLQQSERELTESAKRNHTKILLDNRIDAEIVEYLLRQTKDIRKQIAAWSERYDEDIDAFDTELLTKKESLTELKKQLEQCKSIFNEREEEIEDYLGIKHSRELLAKQNLMTTVLQSWWRGMVHRKNLMPEKRKRKKTKKKY